MAKLSETLEMQVMELAAMRDAVGLVEVTLIESHGINTLKVRVHSENCPELYETVLVTVGPQV